MISLMRQQSSSTRENRIIRWFRSTCYPKLRKRSSPMKSANSNEAIGAMRKIEVRLDFVIISSISSVSHVPLPPWATRISSLPTVFRRFSIRSARCSFERVTPCSWNVQATCTLCRSSGIIIFISSPTQRTKKELFLIKRSSPMFWNVSSRRWSILCRHFKIQ